jgi:hypothetical protein
MQKSCQPVLAFAQVGHAVQLCGSALRSAPWTAVEPSVAEPRENRYKELPLEQRIE